MGEETLRVPQRGQLTSDDHMAPQDPGEPPLPARIMNRTIVPSTPPRRPAEPGEAELRTALQRDTGQLPIIPPPCRPPG